MEELDDAGVRHPLQALLPKLGVGEQARQMHQPQVILDQYDQCRGHHVGEVGRFLQALRPGSPKASSTAAAISYGCSAWVARTLKGPT